MMTSYHRRIHIEPYDIYALAIVKLGSGNNLQGYYMFHGGTNPQGSLSTLQESQASGYWNDLPVKSYDFQAPLGELDRCANTIICCASCTFLSIPTARL